jgi:bifunctional protein TilS/HprT
VAAGTPAVGTLPNESVDFAHNSERQFAKLLDFYGIEWSYEPRIFVLDRNVRGEPVAAFSPDYYLPAYDLYIEITTQQQRLVTRKNRKVREVTALYPGVRVQLLYQRDYLSLLVKYGLEEPAQLRGYQDLEHAGETNSSLLDLGTFLRPAGSRVA